MQSLLRPALIERWLLLVNHVLSAEPAATQRLRPHAGRTVAVLWTAPAGPWPTPPALQLRVTPAGLLESLAAADAAAGAAPGLRVDVSLPAPHRLVLQWLAGERPPVAIDGDAQFAADIAWLAENLRWDLEQDLARVLGDVAAHRLTLFAASARDALRRLVDGFSRRPGEHAADPDPRPASSR